MSEFEAVEAPVATLAAASSGEVSLVPRTTGHRSESPEKAGPAPTQKSAPPIDNDGDVDGELPDALITTNGNHYPDADADAEAASEAETLISSPVKKREAEKKANVAKHGKVEREETTSEVAEPDDDNLDAEGSPEVNLGGPNASHAAPNRPAEKEEDDDGMEVGSDKDNGSELSEMESSRNSLDVSGSRSISPRARSERPEPNQDGPDSFNPRKRKHRASSAQPPSKRRSMEPQRRRLRGAHTEDGMMHSPADHSPSPKNSHRRTVSTQSAVVDLDGSVDRGVGRKRRTATQFPVRDVKIKAAWEESDASSETTSLDQNNPQKRVPRNLGRATSTPGRPGRDHKRHVNKYGFTRLTEACEGEFGDLSAVKEWRTKDPEQLEIAEFAGNKPLQVAALNGNAKIVEYLIGEGCQIDCANVDKDTPLIDAAENGHLDVVEILLQAGVDPLKQNLKGQQALDVITDETEDATEMRAVLRAAIQRWNSDGAKQKREEEEYAARPGPTKGLHFMARTYENLVKLVEFNDRNGVREFLDARVPVDNAVIAAAAKTGDLYLVNMLLAEMTPKKARSRSELPMRSVIGTSHYEMVKSLTQLETFNPLWTNRQGKTWPEIAEERQGANWRQEKELLQALYDERMHNASTRRSSSPVSTRDTDKPRRNSIVKSKEEEDDSGDEFAAPEPSRNRRRLMSKRDMRAANGKNFSDSSDEESMSEGAAAAAEKDEEPVEAIAKVRTSSDSLESKRKVGRPRTKSLSVQSPELPVKGRGRSSSLRELRGAETATSPAMETIEEMQGVQVSAQEDREAGEDRKKKEEQAAMEAKFQADEAQRLDELRKEEEAAEAELMRVAETNQRAKEALRAEGERLAAVAAAEAAAAEVKKEEARRKAAEERAKKEAEREEAKRVHRERMMTLLPPALAHVFNPTQGFVFEGGEALLHLLQHFTPLQVFHKNQEDAAEPLEHEMLVLNYQAAALLGPKGLDLLLGPQDPGYEDATYKSDREAVVVTETQKRALLPALRLSLLQDSACGNVDDGMTFDQELEWAVERYNQHYQAQEQFLALPNLRLVRLSFVHEHLHPLVKAQSLELRAGLSLSLNESNNLEHGRRAATSAELEGHGVPGFVEGLASSDLRWPRVQSWRDSKVFDGAGQVGMGVTKVTIVDETKKK